MINNKYIPVHHSNQFYIFDCLNKWLYPCSKEVYSFFLNAEDIDSVEQINELSKSLDSESTWLADTFLSVEQKYDKKLYIYPEIKREDVIKSLSNVKHITLEITESCNLRCIYCCYGSLYKKIQKHRTGDKNSITDYLIKLLNLRKKYNIKSDLRISFYGGEPLCRFDIIKECVKQAKTILPDVQISFGMTTNGLLLNQYLDYLIEHNFSLFISLDGNFRNNAYRVKVTGENSFHTVKRNIDLIYKTNRKYFDKYISFSTVLHNKSNCIDAIRFFSRWGKVPSFSFVSTSDIKKNNKLFKVISNQHRYSEKELSFLKQKYPDAYKQFFPKTYGNICAWWKNSLYVIDDYNEIKNNERFYYPGATCFLFATKVFVTVDGQLLVCEKISRKYIFGKITEKGFIIYNKKINQCYQNILNKYQSICSKCYKCFSCSKCFFSDIEEIENKSCFCSKEQAIKEINNLVNNK